MTTVTPEIATGPYTERFSAYFAREIAQKAAKSISDGAEMEFQIVDTSGGKPHEIFTFTRERSKNKIVGGPASSPQLRFKVTPAAAEQILAETTDDIGAIGVNILKLVLSPDANRRVGLELKAGFLALFSKGYFGVITIGGGAFSSFLASKGLGGMGAIKAAFKKLRKED